MNRWLWNRFPRYALPFFAAAVVILTGFLLLNPNGRGDSAALPADPKQSALPVYGWSVCADLGLGSVPGLPGLVQRLEVCHGDGWVVQVYCLEPLKPAPGLNEVCSMITQTDFWCGDSAQLLREYQLQQTAAPTSTPLPSATPIPSATPSATASPVPSATQPAPTTPPEEAGPTETSRPAAAATVFARPHAGGAGTASLVWPGFAVLTGLGLLAAAFTLGRRR